MEAGTLIAQIKPASSTPATNHRKEEDCWIIMDVGEIEGQPLPKEGQPTEYSIPKPPTQHMEKGTLLVRIEDGETTYPAN